MNPIHTLQNAETEFQKTRPNWGPLEKRSQKTLEQIQIALQKHKNIGWDWDQLIESEETNRMEKIQAVIASMIEHHLEELQTIVPEADRYTNYVPKLRNIIQEELKKERKLLEETQKTPALASLEQVKKACQKMDLLHDELKENEPRWIETLAQYLAHAPLLEHYVQCGEDTLSRDSTKKNNVSRKLCQFQHPYFPKTTEDCSQKPALGGHNR